MEGSVLGLFRGRLVGWVADCLVGFGWFVGCLVGRLVGWLAGLFLY